MIYKVPLRFTTLHLAQRFLIDDDTFIVTYSFSLQFDRQPQASQNRDYTWACRLRPGLRQG
jgi:hypothetical protein